MHLDWWTIGLQTINFGILVWLLHRFLYKPVLTMIDARKAEVGRQFDAAKELEEGQSATGHDRGGARRYRCRTRSRAQSGSGAGAGDGRSAPSAGRARCRGAYGFDAQDAGVGARGRAG